MPSAFVIPGAGEPSEREFKERVGIFAKNLGKDWDLEPTWWSDRGQHVGRIRDGLPSTYPPRPTRSNLGCEPTIRDAGSARAFPLLANAIWRGRRYLLEAYAGVLADALFYWGNREAIWKDVVKDFPEVGVDAPPVNVIAHSLGGLIAVDLAAAGRVRINVLVTFGTPASVAYVLDPGRMGLPPFERRKPIPIHHITRWTNLWNKYDAVALRMSEVFAVQGGFPDDIPIIDEKHVSSAHLAYWELRAVWDAVRQAFLP